MKTIRIKKWKSQKYLNNSKQWWTGSRGTLMEVTSEKCKISLEMSNKIKPSLEWNFRMKVLERHKAKTVHVKLGCLLVEEPWSLLSDLFSRSMPEGHLERPWRAEVLGYYISWPLPILQTHLPHSRRVSPEKIISWQNPPPLPSYLNLRPQNDIHTP